MSKYVVGRTNGQFFTPNESQIGRVCKTRSFSNNQEVAIFFEHLKKLVPEEVQNGNFYVDLPEVPAFERIESIANIFAEFDEQGWNDRTKLGLLSNWLDSTQDRSNNSLKTFLQEQFDEECGFNDEDDDQ